MTPMISDPFDHSYENQAVNDLLVTVRFAAEKQRKHPAFQGEVSEYVSRPDKLTELAKELETARDVALLQPAELAKLNTLMAACVKALRCNASHVVLLAHHRNDPSLLDDSGYPFKQHSTKAKINILDLLPELQLRHGPVPGSIMVIVKRAKSKASIELQLTENPNDEQSWRGAGEGTYHRARILKRDLEPAKKVYFRARYHEDGGAGRWTSPVEIIVL